MQVSLKFVRNMFGYMIAIAITLYTCVTVLSTLFNIALYKPVDGVVTSAGDVSKVLVEEYTRNHTTSQTGVRQREKITVARYYQDLEVQYDSVTKLFEHEVVVEDGYSEGTELNVWVSRFNSSNAKLDNDYTQDKTLYFIVVLVVIFWTYTFVKFKRKKRDTENSSS